MEWDNNIWNYENLNYVGDVISDEWDNIYLEGFIQFEEVTTR